MTFHETGRMTLGMFIKMYNHYKTDFDMELRLQANNITYADAERKSMRDEECL